MHVSCFQRNPALIFVACMHNCCSLCSVYVNCTSSSCIHFPPLCSSFTLFHLRQQCPSLFSLGSTSLTFFFTWDRNVSLISQSVLKKAEQFFFFFFQSLVQLVKFALVPSNCHVEIIVYAHISLSIHFKFALVPSKWHLPFSIFNFQDL